MIKKTMVTTGFVGMMMGAALVMAQPKQNVSAAKHPHIAAAQRACHNAWQQVSDAQQANEWDMQGHAQKAKELLDQADKELKLAAEAANKNKK